MRRPDPEQLEAEADRLNSQYPVGTPCRYWRGAKEGQGHDSVLGHKFGVLGGHTVVGWPVGSVGCIAATHIECEPDIADAPVGVNHQPQPCA